MGELTSIVIYGKGTDSNIRSLQNFAAKTIRDGKARGVKYNFGNINRVVEREMKKRGLSLESKNVVMRDDTILKYENHPKEAKVLYSQRTNTICLISSLESRRISM